VLQEIGSLEILHRPWYQAAVSPSRRAITIA
jgi:hypothetical protein